MLANTVLFAIKCIYMNILLFRGGATNMYVLAKPWRYSKQLHPFESKEAGNQPCIQRNTHSITFRKYLRTLHEDAPLAV